MYLKVINRDDFLIAKEQYKHKVIRDLRNIKNRDQTLYFEEIYEKLEKKKFFFVKIVFPIKFEEMRCVFIA